MKKFISGISLVVLTAQLSLYSMEQYLPPKQGAADKNYYGILEHLGVGMVLPGIQVVPSPSDRAAALSHPEVTNKPSQEQLIHEIFNVLTDKKKRDEYDKLLKIKGEWIAPRDIIFWEERKPGQYGVVGYVLKQAHFDPQTGTISEFYINPDYPGQALPDSLFFWYSVAPNPQINANQGYKVGALPENPATHARNMYTGQYELVAPVQQPIIYATLPPQPLPTPVPSSTYQPYQPAQYSTPQVQYPSTSYQHPSTHRPSPLDNPRIFQVLGMDSQGNRYGWLSIPADGTNVKQPNAVLARRIKNRVDFIYGDPMNPMTFGLLPKGIWQWRDIHDPVYGYVRITPTGMGFQFRNNTWVHPKTGKQLQGTHVFPNKETEQLFR